MGVTRGGSGGTEVPSDDGSPSGRWPESRDDEPDAPDDETGPKPGDCVGRFTLREAIGQGGVGKVFAALDPVLDREVAVKIVRGNDSRTRTRVMREGQALARLAHANVVTIFDVGVHGDHVFLAMERIPGETLGDWLARPHGWREVRDVLLAAGRGLEAAHAAGLVHRDFKPRNVMVAKGRVVVLDFGLARAGTEPGDEPSTDGASPTLNLEVTQTGARLGTPRYMAPEQHQGVAVTARSDQFAFCVVLHEALTGQRLFEGTTSTEILAAIRSPTPRAMTGVPRFLAAAVARGLAYDPDRRFPSMTALLRVLARDPARTARRWLVVGAAAAALAAGGYAVAGAGAADPCGSGREPLAGVWDEGRREAVRAQARGVDPALGDERAGAAIAALDAYAADWSEMRVASCRATRVSGTQSDTLLDLRVRCLDRRLDEVRGTADLLVGAGDRAALDSAGSAATQLTPLAGCADGAALAAVMPLPEKPADRARALALEGDVLTVTLARRSGALAGLGERARAAVADARALGYAPVLAAALQELAHVLHETGEAAAELDVLRELTQVAAAAHDDDREVDAFTELVSRLVVSGDTDKALALFPAASAAVLRSGNGALARAKQLVAEAKVLSSERVRRGGEALPRLAEARQLLEREGAARRGSPLLESFIDVQHQVGVAQVNAGDIPSAVATFRELAVRYRGALGRDHPAEAFALHNLGEVLRGAGKPEEALVAFKEALRIRRDRMGESLRVADSLVGIGKALHDLGRDEESIEPLEEADRIMSARLLPADRSRAVSLMTLANTHVHLKHYDEGRRLFDQAIALLDGPPLTVNLAVALLNRGSMSRELHRCDDALPDLRRAITVFEETLGPGHFYLIFPLHGAASCLHELGRAAEAMPLLERALAMKTLSIGKREQTLARFLHGRLLFERGGQPARGLAEARAARAEIAALGAVAAEDLPETDRWLAKHR